MEVSQLSRFEDTVDYSYHFELCDPLVHEALRDPLPIYLLQFHGRARIPDSDLGGGPGALRVGEFDRAQLRVGFELPAAPVPGTGGEELRPQLQDLHRRPDRLVRRLHDLARLAALRSAQL